MKRCGSCGKRKPLADFSASTAKGTQSYCKVCQREYKRKWLASSRERVKWNRIYTRYRIRREDYARLVASQDGVCAICKSDLVEPHVDHNHQTGKVRGVLCQTCNHLVGWIEKHGELIDDVQKYLEQAPVV